MDSPQFGIIVFINGCIGICYIDESIDSYWQVLRTLL